MFVCMFCGTEFAKIDVIDFAYSTETKPDGTKVILTEPREVSPCCKVDFEPST